MNAMFEQEITKKYIQLDLLKKLFWYIILSKILLYINIVNIYRFKQY